jgi:hypothetical protein
MSSWNYFRKLDRADILLDFKILTVVLNFNNKLDIQLVWNHDLISLLEKEIV